MEYGIIEKNIELNELDLDLDISFSGIHIYTHDKKIHIKVFVYINKLESLSIVPEKSRSKFLIALGFLSFFTKRPFEILEFDNSYVSIVPKEVTLFDNKNKFILSKINLSKNITIFTKFISNSNKEDKILIYSLLDRLRKANFLSKESEHVPLYIEESILPSFHILELMSDIYINEYKSIIDDKVNSFLENLSNVLYLNEEKSINFINDKKKLYLQVISNELSIKNKILFLLEKLEILDDKIINFIKEAIDTRNAIAHGRNAFVDKTIIPLPVFFPLNKNPFFSSEDILVFVSKVVSKYLGLSLYDNDFETLLNNLPISLDEINHIIGNKDYEKYNNNELNNFIIDLNIYFLNKRIKGRKILNFIKYIIDKDIFNEGDIDIYYLLIGCYNYSDSSVNGKILKIADKLDSHDLRDIMLELESKDIEIVNFRKDC